MLVGREEITPTWEPSGLKEAAVAHPTVAVRRVKIMEERLFLGGGKIDPSLKATLSPGGAQA